MKKSHVLFLFAALTVLLTAGTAQSLSGTNTVDSGDIIDGQVKYIDLKDGSVAGKKILDNSVTGTDINESTLKMDTAEGSDAVCNGDAGTENCASTTLTMSAPGKVQIIATFEFDSDPGTTLEFGTINLVVDGTTVESHEFGDSQDAALYPMPIVDLVNLSAGSHEIKLTFQESDAAEDVDVKKTHIVAARLSA